VRLGSEVTSHYDSLLAKVIAHAPSRERALERLDGALARLVILGPETNTAFLRRLLAEPEVRAGALDTGLVERLAATPDDPRAGVDAATAAALARTLELHSASGDPWDSLLGWRIDGPAPLRFRLEPERGGDVVEVRVTGDPADGARVSTGGGPARDARAEIAAPDLLAVTIDGERRTWAHSRDGDVTRVGVGGRAWGYREEALHLRDDSAGAGGTLEAPMPGSVLAVSVSAGDRVKQGDVLVVLESMKMELQVVAPERGTVQEIAVAAGDRVVRGQLLVAMKAAA
jgi:acetyl-CoA/propionyl-CoA carboxylase biotin carboxyl carrier protein